MAQEARRETHDANVHVLESWNDRPGHQNRQFAFAFTLDNYRHVEAAYGKDVAQRALTHVAETLTAIFDESGRVVTASGGCLNVFLADNSLLDAQFKKLLFQSLRTTLLGLPFHFEGGCIHLFLSGASGRAGEGALPTAPHPQVSPEVAPGLCVAAFQGEAASDDVGWAQGYRADMGEAARLFELMFGERLILAWQAVRNAREPGAVLYYECLPSSVESGKDCKGYCAVAESIPALERLGFARLFDQHVVSLALSELESDPQAVIGVGISAQSAVLDDWWREIDARLRARRDAARRLIIEITETAEFPSRSAASSFVSHMRGLGCRIALDDFGVGFASVRRLIALAPDIVKVDGLFVRRAMESERTRETLDHLVGLAGTIAPTVVVKGIETDEHCRLAVKAGAVWHQGHHSGHPSVARPWLRGERRGFRAMIELRQGRA